MALKKILNDTNAQNVRRAIVDAKNGESTPLETWKAANIAQAIVREIEDDRTKAKIELKKIYEMAPEGEHGTYKEIVTQIQNLKLYKKMFEESVRKNMKYAQLLEERQIYRKIEMETIKPAYDQLAFEVAKNPVQPVLFSVGGKAHSIRLEAKSRKSAHKHYEVEQRMAMLEQPNVLDAVEKFHNTMAENGGGSITVKQNGETVAKTEIPPKS